MDETTLQRTNSPVPQAVSKMQALAQTLRDSVRGWRRWLPHAREGVNCVSCQIGGAEHLPGRALHVTTKHVHVLWIRPFSSASRPLRGMLQSPTLVVSPKSVAPPYLAKGRGRRVPASSEGSRRRAAWHDSAQLVRLAMQGMRCLQQGASRLTRSMFARERVPKFDGNADPIACRIFAPAP